ncbi:MAG TPA: polyphosphate kinase 2 family protein [Xanthobacteraceae bacterium]|nr:polyphosphate kinase 2 family protein [Xanthobacteraceae bacterium]
MKFAKLIKRFRIEKAQGFRLADFDPAATCGMDIGKAAAKDMIADGLRHLTAMQEKLYAQNRWALLVVLQGMDASGKDGIVKHVMSGLNPQGCEVHAFKVPTTEELAHDFLWRAGKHLPARGRIGIFNRSYYEDVLIVRVKRELLRHQRLPPELVSKAIWSERFKSIRAFERHLAHNGTVVLKFHLRISREEQRRRLLARLDEPAKRWKFSMDDVEGSKHWGRYMGAYEDAIRNTATAKAPWYIVPADQKWFAWLMIAAVIGDAMERLDLSFPVVKGKALAELEGVRRALAGDS